MKLLGLTGGVGMGKSTAAGFLLSHGVPVVDTDAIARELVRPGEPALVQIKNSFGSAILTAAGELNRGELARRVFADASARLQLEAILHPRIRECWRVQVARWRQEKVPLACVVIPLLFETQAENQFDKIICLACSDNSQRERLLARGWSLAQIQQRIAAQMPVAQKMARANFVVWTEGTLSVHQQQLTNIVSRL